MLMEEKKKTFPYYYNGEAERYHQNFLELEDSMRKSSRYHTFEESEEENEES